MIIDAAWKALNRLLTPQFRTVFWKTLGVTLLLLVGLWVAIRQVFFSLPGRGWSNCCPACPNGQAGSALWQPSWRGLGWRWFLP